MEEKEKENEQPDYEILPDDYPKYDLSFKIIIIGNSGVGKSCLSSQATRHYFETSHLTTIGFEYFTFNIKIEEKVIKLQIWDTCGQEAYKSLITSFYRNASLAILVYSIDNQNSFNNIEVWLNEIKSQSNPETKIFLIGNKIDLENERKISTETAQQFSNEHAFNYFDETSAKTGANAQNVFIQAAKELYLFHLEYKDRASRIGSVNPIPNQQNMNLNANNIFLNDDDKKKKKKKSCC